MIDDENVDGPFVAANAAVHVPILYIDAKTPSLHTFRYAFEPEGMSKTKGCLVTPEPGMTDGTVIFSTCSNVIFFSSLLSIVL